MPSFILQTVTLLVCGVYIGGESETGRPLGRLLPESTQHGGGPRWWHWAQVVAVALERYVHVAVTCNRKDPQAQSFRRTTAVWERKCHICFLGPCPFKGFQCCSSQSVVLASGHMSGDSAQPWGRALLSIPSLF